MWGQAIDQKLLLPRLNNEKGKKGKIKEEVTELQGLIKNNLLIHFRNEPDGTGMRETQDTVYLHI